MNETAAPKQRTVGPVSVVVCNYNGEEHLPHCLAGILSMRGEIDEVLIVDNRSSDRSLEIINEVWAAAGEAAPKLRIVALPFNDGPGPARNRGMEDAHNRWVLALDNDVVCQPDTLEKLVEAAEARRDAVVVQPRSVFADDPERVHYDGGSFHYVGLISLRNWYRPLATAEGQGAVDVDCLVSLGVLCNRDVLLKMGGYDPAYFILFEDLDLSYRLRLSGHAIVSVEDALVLHRGGTAGISYRSGPKYPHSRVHLHSRNRWLFLIKCFRLRTLLVALPGLLVYEVVWFLFSLFSGGLFAWWRGKREVNDQLEDLIEKRMKVQRNRTRGDRELLQGGPLTVTPSLKAGGLRGLVLSGLDLVLRSWWALARWAAG